jgi:hypothetical protein
VYRFRRDIEKLSSFDEAEVIQFKTLNLAAAFKADVELLIVFWFSF